MSANSLGKQRRPVTTGVAVIRLVGEIKVGNHSPSTRIQTLSAPVHFSVISWQLFKFYRSANQHKVVEAEHPTAPLRCPLEKKKKTSPGCSREVTSAAAHPEEDERRRGKLKIESYLIIAVSPWRMVMLSVVRCISTLRTGNPVGIRHSSLKKEACSCLQHDLRPACILKHGERAFQEQ